MGFLIKSAFWLSLVLLVLPLGGGSEEGEPSVGAFETFAAAQAAISDMAGLCERQPEVCEVGRSALHTIGIRAKEGARIAYGMLDEHLDETGEPIHTGSVPVPSPAPDAAVVPASMPMPAGD
jgi:hypothetical protein